jgi:hypothetical protein
MLQAGTDFLPKPDAQRAKSMVPKRYQQTVASIG